MKQYQFCRDVLELPLSSCAIVSLKSQGLKQNEIAEKENKTKRYVEYALNNFGVKSKAGTLVGAFFEMGRKIGQ